MIDGPPPKGALGSIAVEAIQAVCERLHREAHAGSVLLVAKDGGALARAGSPLESDSLSHLLGGRISAAALVHDKEWCGAIAEPHHAHVSLVGRRAILLVVFDPAASAAATVRMRAQEAGEELARLLEPH
jgi:hypothetical protein